MLIANSLKIVYIIVRELNLIHHHQNYIQFIFLIYGNIDENVRIDHLFSYSSELEKIEPQAHGYSLNGIDSEEWNNRFRELVEEKNR